MMTRANKKHSNLNSSCSGKYPRSARNGNTNLHRSDALQLTGQFHLKKFVVCNKKTFSRISIRCYICYGQCPPILADDRNCVTRTRLCCCLELTAHNHIFGVTREKQPLDIEFWGRLCASYNLAKIAKANAHLSRCRNNAMIKRFLREITLLQRHFSNDIFILKHNLFSKNEKLGNDFTMSIDTKNVKRYMFKILIDNNNNNKIASGQINLNILKETVLLHLYNALLLLEHYLYR